MTVTDPFAAAGARSNESTVPAWTPARLGLAALTASAGAIHFAMAPSHFTQWGLEGAAFVVAAWVQIGLAVAVLRFPSAGWMRATALANLVLLALWVDSRIWGLPAGPEAFEPHASTFVDAMCAGFEAAAVVLAYELLHRPDLGARLGAFARRAAMIGPIAVLGLATVAIASPSARNHAHADSHGGGTEQTHVATEEAGTGGHAHAGGEAAAKGAEADDKGLSLLMNGQGDGGGHAHDTSVVELDAATQATLDGQLAHTEPFIDKYPTVADAVAAGYKRQGPFSPGLGAHYMGPGLGASLDGGVALDQPTLIYDGIDPDSKLAGFMYNIFSMDTKNPPEGFAGANDHWHYHTNVCLVARPGGGVDAPLGADTSAPKSLCDKYGGRIIANTGYMVHVWTVPGYESPQGLFSNVNAKITCPNRTYYTVKMEEIGNRSNVCRDVPA